MPHDPLDLHEVCRLLAAQEVRRVQLHDPLDPDSPPPPSGAFALRRIKRRFSQWFHTPLPLVDELPLDYVLQHYYDHLYDEMAGADSDGTEGATDRWHEELDRLADTPVEAAQRARLELVERKSNEEYHRSVEAEARAQLAAERETTKKGPRKESGYPARASEMGGGVADVDPTSAAFGKVRRAADEVRRVVGEGGSFSVRFEEGPEEP